jgi:hypothetical protein
VFNVGSGVWLWLARKGILNKFCISLDKRSIFFISHITKCLPITGQLGALELWLSSTVTALALYLQTSAYTFDGKDGKV